MPIETGSAVAVEMFMVPPSAIDLPSIERERLMSGINEAGGVSIITNAFARGVGKIKKTITAYTKNLTPYGGRADVRIHIVFNIASSDTLRLYLYTMHTTDLKNALADVMKGEVTDDEGAPCFPAGRGAPTLLRAV